MKFHLSSWIAAASFSSFHPTSVDAVGGGLRSPDRRLQNGNAYGKWKKCVVLLKEVQLLDGELEEVDCYDPETQIYHRLEASLEEKLKKDIKNNKVKSGSTTMNADGSYDIDGDGHRVLHVSDVDSITYEDFVPEHGRRLAVTTGTKEMLAIRVVAADASTTASEAEISDSWFGTNGDSVNLKSQYFACSYGALEVNAASKTTTTGVNVANGVHEVTISNTVSGAADGVIRDAVVTAGNSALGTMQSQFDHVMLCLPPGTSGGWIGYAYINWYLSVFNNDWCNYVSIQMHEIGHNLNLAHSGEGTNQYGDQTAMMGYSYSQDDQNMCFNAPKNWQLGWYPNGEHTVVNKFFEGKILGLSDYGSLIPANNEIIMAKINDGIDDWYVSFNRDAGINSGTQEGQDQVLVHKRPQGTGYAESDLMAKLNAGSTYNGITVDGSAVPVTVSSIDTSSAVGYAQVKIGNGAPTTPEPTPAPTPPPTQAPVPPTLPPTPSPTPLPTPPPTSAPVVSVGKYRCSKWEPDAASICIDGSLADAKCTTEGENGSSCGNGGKVCWWASCPDTGGGPGPSPTPPSPTPPSPTPPSPTPNCPVCEFTGEECCGKCNRKRGCV